MSASAAGSGPWRATYGGVAAQRGERRAQLVRGVADEPLLGLARALERREHRVQGLGQLADLVARRRHRQALGGVAAALDAARARRQPPQRAPARGRRTHVASAAASSAATMRRDQRRTGASWRACPRIPAVVPATITAPPAALPRPSSPSGAAYRRIGSVPELRRRRSPARRSSQRGCDRAASRAARGCRGPTSGRRSARGRSTTCTSSSLPPRRPSSVPGLGQQVRRRGGQPRDLDRALAQRPVERTLELVAEPRRARRRRARRRRRRSPRRRRPRRAAVRLARLTCRAGSPCPAPCGSAADRRACGAGRRRSGRRRCSWPRPRRPRRARARPRG